MRKAITKPSNLTALYFAVLFCYVIGARATCVSVKHPPSKAACGIRGKLADKSSARYYQNPSITDTWKECMSLCFSRVPPGYGNGYGACPAFYFNSTSNLCHFAEDLHLTDIKQDKSSDTIFYDRDCFDCTAQKCPAPKGPNGHGNEIDNGGFENSDNFIGPWTGDYYFLYKTFHPTNPGFNSPQAFHCHQDGIEQSYPSCPGQTHRIDFNAASVESSGKDRPTLSFFDSNGRGGVGWGPTQGEIDKKPKNQSLFYNAQSRYGLVDVDCTSFYSRGSAIIVDNFRLRPVDMSTLKVLGEKVINGDFESGKLEPTQVTTPSKDKVSIISPGLKGSKFALQASGLKRFQPVFLIPKINATALGKGKRLYRLSIDTDVHGSSFYQLGLVYNQKSHPRETEIYGKVQDFSYFYADRGDFPLWITLYFNGQKSAGGVMTIDNISVRELQEE